MKVTIFSTCVVDLLFPNVGQAMVEVLERLGCETSLPTKFVVVSLHTTAVTTKRVKKFFTMKLIHYCRPMLII